MYMYVCMHVCMHVYMCVYMRTYIHTCIHANTIVTTVDLRILMLLKPGQRDCDCDIIAQQYTCTALIHTSYF
jgi:hypothetical protein